MNKQPLQPIYIDDGGSHRFKANAIVRYLLDKGGLDLNHLAVQDFPIEDQEQFAQLIGYSLNGFSELSYVSDDTYQLAARTAENPEKTESEVKIEYLESQVETVRTALRVLVPEFFKIHPDDLEV